jgi:hypothetical protein
VAYGVLRNRADAEEVAQEAPPVRRRRSNSFRKRFVGAWSRSHRSWR